MQQKITLCRVYRGINRYWRRELKKDRKKAVRRHRKTILFNDKEIEAIQLYCKRYKVTSHAKFCREAIISTILKRFDEDHPTLF